MFPKNICEYSGRKNHDIKYNKNEINYLLTEIWDA